MISSDDDMDCLPTARRPALEPLCKYSALEPLCKRAYSALETPALEPNAPPPIPSYDVDSVLKTLRVEDLDADMGFVQGQAALHVQRRIKEEFGTLHRLYSLNPADRRREGACRFCGEAGQDNGLHALSCPELPPPLQEEREKLVSDCGGWQCLRLDDVYMSHPMYSA
eukprot:Polyplicarium_translucidae@DN3403_c1_g1_i3.p1